ncbi:MAG: DNA translocase FtsK [Chloroflexi bacterium]|nr:DNA translocase FtsK [Chloroflexota bacterium]
MKSSPNMNQNGGKPPGRDFFRSILKFIIQFRRFGWDLIGIILILLTILSLLGLVGLSSGTVINLWVSIIQKSLGWIGSFILILMFGLGGVFALMYSAGKKLPLSIARILILEGMFFSFLALLSVFGGTSLDRSESGKDGGTLGWGLANLIPGIPGTIVVVLTFLLFLGLLTGFLKKWIEGLKGMGATKQADSTPWQNEKTLVKRPTPIRTRENLPEGQSRIIQTHWRDDRLPPINLLMSEHTLVPDQAQIKTKALTIENTLAEFGFPVKVVGFRVGPTVTQFALEPGYVTKTGPDGQIQKQKVRVSQISALSRDLTLALSASRLRIETPVPGRSYVGIEVPNSDSASVRLRPMLESSEFKALKSPLAIGLGKNVSGEAVAADLEKMPHLLIAGTTNSGKSVCITAITTCLIMNNTPRDLKLVMLDPKMVELVRFNGVPHLIGKVETELERMLAVLRWAQTEMDARYRLLAEAKVRNLESYNRKMLQKKQGTLPRIVILIDELADLMMSAPDQTEHSLIRLAQMARATGIHLVVATQRPSTDVVTGLIKANFPARISFAVASSVDSRVILDSNGAESLLGKGDMLFLDPTKSGLTRVQGIIINDLEVEKVINHWKRMSPAPEGSKAPWESMAEEITVEEGDKLVDQAIGVVKAAGKASVSLLQRRLRVGYPRAARLIDELEEMGIVGPSQGSGKDREVFLPSDKMADLTPPED